MKKYILLLLILSFTMSCKTKTVANQPINTNAAVVSNAVFFNKIKAKPDFQQLKINSRVSVESGSFIPTLDATIYIENDKKVWMNMTAIFLNVGRGLATPEGIKGYEKWNKTYIESDFSYLNQLMNVNFIDFSVLQNLLMGRNFLPIQAKDFFLTQNAQGYHLSSAKNLTFEKDGKVSQYIASMDYSNDFDLLKVNLKDVKSDDDLEIYYGNWQVFENIKVPQNVKIIIKGSKTGQILLENTKFESSKMDTPYTVPNNYTKTEIR